MPFRSKAQVRYMFANHPRIAKRWADKYGIPKNLPQKAKDGQRRKRKREKKSEFNPEAPMSFEEQVINAIQTAAAALEKADELYEKNASAKRRVASLIPSVVDELAKRGYIDHMEKDAASRALQDHTKALQILSRVVSRGPTQKSAASIGRPYAGDPGSAGHVSGSSSSFRVVARETDSQANRAFLRALGLEHMLS